MQINKKKSKASIANTDSMTEYNFGHKRESKSKINVEDSGPKFIDYK